MFKMATISSIVFLFALLQSSRGVLLNQGNLDSVLNDFKSAGELYTLSDPGLVDSQLPTGFQEVQRRLRRQVQTIDPYREPITSDLTASQHCDGIYLRWKRPPHPTSKGEYTNSEFRYYNVYRSTKYFTVVRGMSPYASGKKMADLRILDSVAWLDRDPLTNDAVWYAVTMVTRKGKEEKEVTPAKAMYVGAFGAAGSTLPLTNQAMKGNTLHHSAIFNKDRNEYFVAWDVDSNLDGKPDRIYTARLNQAGAVVDRQLLDITVNLPGVQGWPSVAYNPITNEYLVIYQLSTVSLFGGRSLIISQRVRAQTLKPNGGASLLLKANDNKNGRTVPIPVQRPKVIFNPATGGYVTIAELVGVDSRHGIATVFTDATLASKKVSLLFPTKVDARSGRVFYDTKRKQLFIVAQLPHNAINKGGDIVPKLPYVFLVSKRNATGAAFGANPINIMGGETTLLDSSLSGFYDEVIDRLMLFWSDVVGGKRVIKSSRVILDNTNARAVEFMKDNQKEICNTPTDVKMPFAAPYSLSGGPLVVWEQSMSGKWKIGGSLIKDASFSFAVRNQRRPIVVANQKTGQFLVLWQEVINSKTTNLFARILKPVSHTCMSCSAPLVCLRDERCVQPFKAKHPCSVNNGGCKHVCFKSYTGAQCACRKGYKLQQDRKTCEAKGRASVRRTMIFSNLNELWRATLMSDGTKKFDRIPYSGSSFVAVGYNSKDKMLYWSDVDKGYIARGKMDGTSAEVLVRNIASDGLAIDSAAGLLYWTDFKGKKIEVMATNKNKRRVLASSGVDKPRAMALCKQKASSYIFWSDWGSSSKIERLQLDASGYGVLERRTVVANGLGWPNGLAVDCDAGKLYWVDAQYDKMEVSDLMGNNRKTLAGATLTHPYALAITGKSIVWTDWSGVIFEADKDTGLNQKAVIGTLHRPAGLDIIEGKVDSMTNCADPGVPQNGVRQGNDFAEDETVVFQCNSGYKIVGDAQITCQSNGKWTERAPFCIEIRCQTPPRPLHGNRVIAGTSIGEGVVYTCNPGYIRVGSRVRKCEPGGKWKGTQPRCLALPVFVERPRNDTVSFGKAVVIQCKASADSVSVKTTWLKDGRPFNAKDISTRIFIFKTSILIQKARYSDSGVFTCQVKNEAGSIHAHAHLRVLGKKTPQCGIPKFTTRQRIIGGRVAGAGSHPWIAMLWSEKYGKLFCGGSLIAEQWVLTAAHCLQGMSDITDTRVKLGKLNSKKIEPNEQIKRVVKVYKHPSYDSNTFDSDVALLKLDSPVRITDFVIPICLPYDDSDLELLKPGVKVVVSGWGSKNLRQVEKSKFSRKLLEVEVPVADTTDCKSKMNHPVTANMFCAGAGENGDSCKGDSGGPVVIKNKKTSRHVQTGIVSWGEGCGNSNSYGVYVKLYNFLSWVNSITS